MHIAHLIGLLHIYVYMHVYNFRFEGLLVNTEIIYILSLVNIQTINRNLQDSVVPYIMRSL